MIYLDTYRTKKDRGFNDQSTSPTGGGKNNNRLLGTVGKPGVPLALLIAVNKTLKAIYKPNHIKHGLNPEGMGSKLYENDIMENELFALDNMLKKKNLNLL